MVEYVYEDEDADVAVDLIVDGEFIVPDAGTVTWTVRKHDGSTLSGYKDVAVVTDDTTTSVTVPLGVAMTNIVNEIENRFITVKGTADGRPFQINKTVRVTRWFPIAATTQNVRNFIGLAPAELGDDEVDLVETFLEVREDVGASTFTSALTGLPKETFAANNLVIYRAAMKVIPNLQHKLSGQEKTDSLQFQRLSGIDFEATMRRAASLYANTKQALTGNTVTNPVLVTMTQDTDYVTGA